MSILGGGSSRSMKGSTPFLNEFKKQASFFFKEKIKTARLALTDVTPAQLLTEEATGGNPGGPETRALKMISKAAFEVDDYWRIVEILHKRFGRFERQNWRLLYNSLIVLEHLLTHGPESVAEEFQTDKDVIKEMDNFQHIDEKGFNWGLNVRKKSERVLKLLEKGPLLKEERDRARKLTRGIEGFGSFTGRTSSSQNVLHESPFRAYRKSNSQFNGGHGDHEDQDLNSNHEDLTNLPGPGKSQTLKENVDLICSKTTENFRDRESSKENMAPKQEVVTSVVDFDEWNSRREAKPLLVGEEDDPRNGTVPVEEEEEEEEEEHPFNETENISSMSLISSTNRTLQAY